MRWSYKTVHFELKKEGLLGAGFLDESEIEQALNNFGRSGWELISVLEVQDGIIAFFKQPLGPESRYPYREEETEGKDYEEEAEGKDYEEETEDRDYEKESAGSLYDEPFAADPEDAAEKASANSFQDRNMIGAIKIE